MLAPIWVVEVIAGEWIAPILKNTYQLAPGHVLLDDLFQNKRQPETGQRRIEHLRETIKNKLAVHTYVEFVYPFFEIPREQAAQRRQAHVDAVMIR